MTAAALAAAVGARLRAARRERGLRLREVAALAGLSVTHVSGVERGGAASVAALYALCAALGTTVSALVAAAERDLTEESK